MPNPSILKSVLFLKCPRCRQGKFLESHPYDFAKMNKVYNSCPKCKQNYKMEPSFYTGSMYVSYGVGVAVAVAVYMILLILGKADDPLTIFISIVIALILTFPYIGAVSKSIWAHIFIKYDKEAAKRVNQNTIS